MASGLGVCCRLGSKGAGNLVVALSHVLTSYRISIT